MKWFITGWAFAIIASFSLVFQHNYNLHQEQMEYLKYVSQEAAAAASQYFYKDKYGDGYLIYNKDEGEKAAKAVIISLLKLNPDMTPTENTYWKRTNKITFDIKYFDEENNTFPMDYTYTHPKGNTNLTMFGPSVIVRINVGKAKYDWLKNDTEYYRIGVHSFDE